MPISNMDDLDNSHETEPAPRVSIGMPVYNGEDFLAEAIESVLGQTFVDFELIVSDNCSTDRTPEIVKAYAEHDRRIRYLRNETNLGAIGNFNRCVERARGTYFKWQAHDDALEPTYLDRCVAALDADPEVVLAHSRTVVINGDSEVIASSINPFFDWNSASLVRRFRSSMRDLFCYEIYGVMRKDKLDRTLLHGPFRGGDKTLLAEMSLLGKFRRVEEPLFLRRVHESMSGMLSGNAKRSHSGHVSRMPYRLRAFGHYFKTLSRHRVPWRLRLVCYGEIAKMCVAYHRWYKLLVPGPSNYFGLNGPGKPDAGVAGEGGLLVRMEADHAGRHRVGNGHEKPPVKPPVTLQRVSADAQVTQLSRN